MPKCTPEEELIDPCLCRLFDCQLEASSRGHTCREQVVALRMGEKITSEEGLDLIEDCSDLETLEKEVCVQEFTRCAGKPPSEQQPGSPLSKKEKEELKRTFERTIATTARVKFVAEMMKKVKLIKVVPKAGKAMGIAVSGFARIGKIVKEIADDPPDSNFNTIPRPVIPKIPPIKADQDLGPGPASAFNQLIEQLALMVGLAQAMATAINRSQGAELAGDTQAQDDQISAARGFAGEWAEALAEAPARRAAVIDFFPDLSISGFSVALPEAITLRHKIIKSGWPKLVSTNLGLFGLKGTPLKEVLALLTLQLGDVLALTNKIEDQFVDAAFVQQEIKLRNVLAGFASEP